MNRSDLSWALNAVLPHVGTANQGLDHVGFTFRDGASFIYATDRYTTAIARVNDGMDFTGALPAKEATDLMRFVRPNKVGERTQDLVYANPPGELHIGFDVPAGDFTDGTELESEIFETCEPSVTLDYLLSFISDLENAPEEWDELILQPKLVEKFAKAQRNEADRLRILPRHVLDMYGAAVVTVGSDFLGAIAGMTYDQAGEETVESFLAA